MISRIKAARSISRDTAFLIGMARESLRDMHIVSHSRSLILHLKAPLQKFKVNIDDYCLQVCC